MEIIEEINHECAKHGINAVVLESIGSTNDYASSANLPHGTVVIALNQTLGRGQRGNRWSVEPGANITMSIVLNPIFLPAGRQFLLSQALSLAVVGTLAQYGIKASVKWPNDIYVANRKISGILIENDIMGVQIGRSIAGIGINVNQTLFDPSLPNPTSMALEAGCNFNIAKVLCVYYLHFMALYGELETGEYHGITKRYSNSLFRKNERYMYKDRQGRTFYAVIEDTLPGGELILKHDDGTCCTYLFKEVEYVIE